MPNIIIKELDNTTAGSGAYNNFTVLIPGLVATDKVANFIEVADEYGIYECSSLDDFKANIGVVKNNADIAELSAKAPELLTADGQVITIENARQFYVTYANQVYTLTTGDVEDGKLKISEDTSTSVYGSTDYAGTYTAATEYNDGTIYYVILKGHEGNNEIEASPQIGNQLAYEWLSIGGTVLFKRFEELNDLTTDEFWDVLKDKSNYDFRYIIPGFLYLADVNYGEIGTIYSSIVAKITKLAKDRGDCTALIDVPDSVFVRSDLSTVSDRCNAIADYVNGLATIGSGKYTTYFAPSVTYAGVNSKEYYEADTNYRFPATFHYLVCAAEAQLAYPEYFAVAGLTRGRSNNYVVKSTGCIFGEEAVNKLSPRIEGEKVKCAVNLISKIRNAYYIEGNRTAHLLDNEGLKASHFLNIRQLCSTIVKQLYINCKQFQFDPNSSVLWIKFCGAISPLLDSLKANQGIADYKIQKVRSTQKAELKAIIRIVPIEAVEDFEITLSLEDSVSGIPTVTIEE